MEAAEVHDAADVGFGLSLPWWRLALHVVISVLFIFGLVILSWTVVWVQYLQYVDAMRGVVNAFRVSFGLKPLPKLPKEKKTR